MTNILKNVSLQPFNTFGFDVQAHSMVRCSSLEEIQQGLSSAQEEQQSVIILGGGSNILLTKNLDALVLKIEIKGIEVLDETSESVRVRAGAGENWHEFVLHALSRNWGGVENLSLIPGTVGAAPMQNIGAYGVEIEHVFHSLRAINRTTGELYTFKPEQCEFGYRESVFKKELKEKFIIYDVTFDLTKPPHHQLNTSYGAIESTLAEWGVSSPSIHDVSNAVIAIRQSKLPDPAKIGNSGSFFKNPAISNDQFNELKQEFPELPGYPMGQMATKVPAGWLIERCGWKGFERNGVGVHKKQALVLVNYGDGRGEEVEKLARAIQESVESKFGITLHPEVNIL
jgi:UDP-N-acetylmuramate dehydrogenase